MGSETGSGIPARRRRPATLGYHDLVRLVPRLSCTVILCLTPALPASGLDPSIPIERFAHQTWRRSDGLPRNGVTALASTPDGYLWIGTQGGLARFDGLRFTEIDTSARDEFVTALIAHANGDLWVGTRSGLLRLGPRGDLEEVGTSDPTVSTPYIRSLAHGSGHQMWSGTSTGTVTGWIGGHPHPFASTRELTGGTIRALLEDPDGTLWIGSSRGLFSARDGRLEQPPPWLGSTPIAVRALAVTTDGLWVGTERAGLLLLTPDGPVQQAARLGLATDEPVWTLMADRDDCLWVGAGRSGVRRLCGDRLSTMTAAAGLAGDVVWSLHEDSEGSVWIGTRVGLTQLKDSRVSTYPVASSTGSNYIRTVLEGPDGSLLVGTERGVTGLRAGRTWEPSWSRLFAGQEVRSLLNASDGSVWVGTRREVTRLPGRHRHLASRPPPVLEAEINALAEDGSGCVWIGTGGDGALRWCAGELVPLPPGCLPNSVVRVVHASPDGTAWIGHEGGLTAVENGTCTTLTVAEGLPSDFVYAVHEESSRVLWVGTGNGIARVDDGSVTAFTEAQGLPRVVVFQVLEDRDGDLWLSSARGITRLSRPALERAVHDPTALLSPRVFTEGDGMWSSECIGGTQPAGTRTADGHLWFPTSLGVCRVDPERLDTEPVPPRVLIERVVVDDRELALDQLSALPPGTRRLEIHYTAPTFVAPRQVRFRHRLHGFDSSWAEVANARSARFTRLSPGRYRFEVAAAVAQGRWSDQPTPIVFSVLPHFWQTRWFLGLVAIFFLVFGPAIHRYRLAQGRRRERLLRDTVERRTRQLRTANAALKHLAVTDSLTGIANHRKFRSTLASEWRRCTRSLQPLSLIMVDIDYFKAYNDLHGHLAGDETLRAVGQALLAAASRPGDLVARYGGEEFGVVLPETDCDGALTVARAIQRSISQLALPHGASPVGDLVTVSLGIATTVPVTDAEPDSLIAAADRALYGAKRSGRDSVRSCADVEVDDVTG
jgi:diguanylate cyclase (GGDEF)-like protein